MIISLFVGSVWLQLYFFLLVFVCQIVFDTQMVIKRAHSGVLDYVGDALLIYSDLVAVFLRVLDIMVS